MSGITVYKDLSYKHDLFDSITKALDFVASNTTTKEQTYSISEYFDVFEF